MERIVFDKSAIEKYILGFQGLLLLKGGTLNLRKNQYYKEQESYKEGIAKKANDALYSRAWLESDIGKGDIYECVSNALKEDYNLVYYMSKIHFDNVCNDDMGKAEHALYSLYCKDDDEAAFNELVEVFGAKYDLISYLLFINNCQKYAPLRPSKFDERFKKIGLDFTTSHHCTWENYNDFLEVLKTIQVELNDYLNLGASLLDAHSFVWMFWAIDEFFETEAVEEIIVEDKDYETNTIVRRRIGQSTYRKDLISYWNNHCSVTGCTETKLLVASHIKPWCKCETNSERYDKYNGFLLTPNLDKAFDMGVITFGDDGKIIISEKLSPDNCMTLGISKDMHLLKIEDKHKKYLEYHRNCVFDKIHS